MQSIRYEDWDRIVPKNIVIWRDVVLNLFPVIDGNEVSTNTGEKITATAVVVVNDRSFFVYFKIIEGVHFVQREEVARRLFPELVQHVFVVRA